MSAMLIKRAAGRLLLGGLVASAFAVQAHASVVFNGDSGTGNGGVLFSPDPTSTYLRVNNDPNATNAVGIDLNAIGIQAGDIIQLFHTGDYADNDATPDPSANGMVGVFSVGDIILDGSNLNRLPGAIYADTGTTTAATQVGGLTTDILQDFAIQADVVETVHVPSGATHLFVSANDDFFGDNTDFNNTFFVRVSKLGDIDFNAGYSGSGSLTIDGAVHPQAVNLNLGLDIGSSGTATVTGLHTRLDLTGSLGVGQQGTGTMTISNGAVVSVAGPYSEVANGGGSTGTLTVTGVGSRLEIDHGFSVANGGVNTDPPDGFDFGVNGALTTGTMNVLDGAVVTVGDRFSIANTNGPTATDPSNGYSNGTVNIDRAGSRIEVGGNTHVGDFGDGALTLTNGAALTTGKLFVANHSGSTGTVDASDSLTTIDVASDLFVGNHGDGSLTLSNGAALTAKRAFVATNAGSTGNLTVDNASLDLFANDQGALLSIGHRDTGSMLMTNNAEVSVLSTTRATTAVNVGRDGAGTLDIESGSTLRIGTNAGETRTSTANAGMSIGFLASGGSGGPGGAVTVDGGTLKIRTNGAANSGTFAFLNVGLDSADGELTVENGGHVSVADIGAAESSISVGRHGTNGVMTIRDTGSSVSVEDYLNVGFQGGSGTVNVERGGLFDNTAKTGLSQIGRDGNTGTLNVTNGGDFRSNQLFVGRDGGVGTVNVSGATTNFDLNAGSLIGFTGTGTMNITNEAKVDATDFIVVGRAAGGTGFLNIDRAGSQLNLTGLDAGGDGPGLVIGLDGSGFMTVRNGGVVTVNARAPVTGTNTGGIALGGAMTAATSNGFGRLDIDGAGSAVNLLTPDAEVHIGRQGTGIVNVTAGGSFSASADGVIGREVGSAGVLNVLGAGSQASFGDHLFIGTDVDLTTNTATGPGGSGIVDVGSGGVLTAVNTVIGSGGILKGSGGTVNGNVTVAGGIFAPGNSPGTMTINGDLLLDMGTLQLETEGGVSDEIIVNGSVLIGAGAMIELLFDTVPAAIDLADFFTVGNPLTDIVFDSGFGAGNITVLATAPGGAGMSVDVTYGGTTTSFVAAAVPEPATLVLFGFGLAGLAAAGRRRRRTGAAC